jgi:hypothetical protein
VPPLRGAILKVVLSKASNPIQRRMHCTFGAMRHCRVHTFCLTVMARAGMRTITRCGRKTRPAGSVCRASLVAFASLDDTPRPTQSRPAIAGLSFKEFSTPLSPRLRISKGASY